MFRQILLLCKASLKPEPERSHTTDDRRLTTVIGHPSSVISHQSCQPATILYAVIQALSPKAPSINKPNNIWNVLSGSLIYLKSD